MNGPPHLQPRYSTSIYRPARRNCLLLGLLLFFLVAHPALGQSAYVDDGQSGLGASIGYARLEERGGVRAMLAATVAGRIDIGTSFTRVSSPASYITSYRPFLSYLFLKADTLNPFAMGIGLLIEKTSDNHSDRKRRSNQDYIGGGFNLSLDLADRAGRFSRLRYSFGFAHMEALESTYESYMLAQMVISLLLYSPDHGPVWVLQPRGTFTMGERHESTFSVSLGVVLNLREERLGR
jgi:hypothetical protein